MTDLPPLPLPAPISARFVETATGLNQHILQAGDPGAPLLLLLHGFPEIAFSWRHIMPALADAGYWVVAPDLRGAGRTTGWDNAYDTDLRPFSMLRLVRDNLALIHALGRERAAATIGHDFGAPLTAWTALIRPDISGPALMMSSPFAGAPTIAPRDDQMETALLALDRPRKHYQRYYSTRPANADMVDAPQGLHAFLRAYYHMKSADWAGNDPHELAGWTAEELAKMPTYYIMDADETMAETVAHEMPSEAEISGNTWLPESDLAVYAGEFTRTGFQGGLNWYRTRFEPELERDHSVFQGARIQVPTRFIAGRQDWGWAQFPGALDALAEKATADHRGTRLIDGAGHWVQQEQPGAVVAEILDFLTDTRTRAG